MKKNKIRIKSLLISIVLLCGFNQAMANVSSWEDKTVNARLNGIGGTVINSTPPYPGIEEPDPNACSDIMGSITFTSATKFITSNTAINSSPQILRGMTSPIVADLNHDGKPEIISLTSSGDIWESGTNGVQVFNSNGKQIGSRLLFRTSAGVDIGTLTHSAHESPNIFAVADVDNDGIAELIVAFPNTTGALACKVVAYKLTPTGNGDATTYTLDYFWESSATYRDPANTNFRKAIPTIVNIDGKGHPEVVVYNKIYDAVTGDLKLTMETLGTDAYVGASIEGYSATDTRINFNYIYDMDADGIYDVVAGGKIYKISSDAAGNLSYQVITASYGSNQIPDGRTAVADIDGDGRPDVVAIYKTNATTMIIDVWNPNLLIKNGDGTISPNPNPNPTPTLLARRQIAASADGAGDFSNAFIGDIDGRVQNINGVGYRLPEISVLRGYINFNSTARQAELEPHPNIPSGSFPTSIGNVRVLTSFTYDLAEADVMHRLKLSFALGHSDRSQQTGFTLFDFDNDGIQEIAYRDERTMRIIKPLLPYVAVSATSDSYQACVLFSQNVTSATGYESPIVVDIDNDAAADIIVHGYDTGTTDLPYRGYVFAFSNGSGDKFAPSRSVWNQYHYDPFMINDDLTVPAEPAVNRLSDEFNYTRVNRNANGEIASIIENYNPYNNTMVQIPKLMVQPVTFNGITYPKGIEPLVYLTSVYIVQDGADKPSITGSTDANAGIKMVVGNKAGVKSTVPANTPIIIYKTEVNGTANRYLKTTLADWGMPNNTVIEAGQEIVLNYSLPASPTGFRELYGTYVIRLGDDSDPGNNIWKFGTNNLLAPSDPVNHVGAASKAFRDCDWSDQSVKVAKFMLNDDVRTIQKYDSIVIDVLGNDIFVDTQSTALNDPSVTITQPVAGTIQITADNKIKYIHLENTVLPNAIDTFSYEMRYDAGSPMGVIVRKAYVYIFVLEGDNMDFSACAGTDYTINLRSVANTTYDWYDKDGSALPNWVNPSLTHAVGILQSDTVFQIQPIITGGDYGDINFPNGILKISVMTTNQDGSYKQLKWTGTYGKNWSDPKNWTLNDQVSSYAPTACVDALLPTGLSVYPSSSQAGFAHYIDVKDNAMLANSQFLTYDSLMLELKFEAIADVSRWLAFSAPMVKSYSGDFLIREKDSYPVHKAISMILFQEANPDNPAGEPAAPYQFTKAFAKEDVELGLGKSFVIYLNESVLRNGLKPPALHFPSAKNQYEYYYASEWGHQATDPGLSTVLERSSSLTTDSNDHLIADGATFSSDTSFTVTMSSDLVTSKVLLVTNPFNAWLNLTEFFKVNPGLHPYYYVWSGSTDGTFIQYDGTDNRWKMDSSQVDSKINSSPANQYIGPFRSFFVRKTNENAQYPIKFKPGTMTNTFTTP
jgi:hypothetical protein